MEFAQIKKKRRSSLFHSDAKEAVFNPENEVLRAKMKAEADEYRQIIRDLTEEYENELQNEQKEKKRVNIGILSAEKQEFLSSLPNLNNYKATVTEFLNKVSIHQEEIELMKNYVEEMQMNIVL